MRAVHLTGPDPASLQPVELATPEPGPGEILVRVRAASLNYLDWVVATGGYPGLAFPIIPVSDAAGEVAALGDGVSEFAPGDRVTVHFKPFWGRGPLDSSTGFRSRGVNLPGSLADYVVAPAAGVIRTPSHLTDAQAATLPIAATTAWNALRAGPMRPGSTVVLLGAGGVSLFALQFAKAQGARVILTSSSDDKLDRARALGADETINYLAHPDWDEEVRRLTDGRGADLVLELGGAGTLPRSVNAAALNGTVVVIGFVSGAETTLNVGPILSKALRLQGVNTGSVADLADAAQVIERHRLEPVLDSTFSREDAVQAYRRLGSGSHFGKIALLN